MNNRFKAKAIVGFLMAFLLLVPFLISTEKQTVKVVVENAGIRLKPDMESEILEFPQIGRVFEVEEKAGGWFKIRFTSQVGIPITGYIHEMYVEEIVEDVTLPVKKEPEPKREPERKPAPPIPVTKPRDVPERAPRTELILSGGYNTGFSAKESITYSETFAYQLLTRGESRGTISSSLQKPLGFGGALNIFFSPVLGIQIRADLNSKAEVTPESISTYSLSTLWSNGQTASFANEWGVTGDASVTALSANIVIRSPATSMFVPFFSGGVSYYTGQTRVNTTIAQFDTWLLGNIQYYAAFVIPVGVDAAVGGIGFNAGGGAHILFSPNFGVSLEARYFMKSAVEQSWSIKPGTYRSFLGNLEITLDQAGADAIAKKIPPYELTPSFLKASLGFIFRF